MRYYLILLTLFWLSAAQLQAAPLPVEHFANLPDVSRLALSPSGTKLCAIVRIDVGETNGTGIQVTDLSTSKKDFVLFSDNSKYFIGNARWKDDTTLLVETWYPSKRDTWTGLSQARYETRELRLLIINTQTGEVSSPFKKSYLKKYKVLPNVLSRVVDTLPNDPDHILMSIPGLYRNYAWYPVVTKVNIKNQMNKTLKKSEERVFGWGTDQQGRIRSSYSRVDEIITSRVKDIKTGEWRELWPYAIFSDDEVEILGFDKDPNIVYISAYQNNFKAIFKVDLRDKDLNRELVYSEPNYDVSGYLVHSLKDDRVLGIGSAQETGTKFIDPEFKALQESIDRALTASRNFIYSITKDENKYLVYSTGPKESGSYYLGTRSPASLKAVAYRYNKLVPDVLSDVERIEYQSRDGQTIEGYLTVPRGAKPENLPTLMFPHGGPMARDSNSFDAMAQFFANRGYAVLQMNFRGSAGQGIEFRNSGLKKWGKEMQDDIEDGALALIKRGITDPERICIVGASYGGYAALMGVVKTPDRYQCSISINGVSNVFDLVKDNRSFRSDYNVVDEQIGNDNKTLREISPVNFPEKVKVPVLLIHGVLDRQVDVKHSQQMHEALKAAGKNVTYIEQDGEDHYLSNEVTRVQAYQAMADFLGQYLPVDN
ncbi:alpha/beta hydrolase family protein [Teredinibacter waterburyi]|uniref:alpha/beta hydrolase family protein n=1 Tax=Teredinibacter waterburyi TaxID=1500538 RepID=UPI00165FAFE5|nr:S9 family peptidase [Teredinibacter waterburyi]